MLILDTLLNTPDTYYPSYFHSCFPCSVYSFPYTLKFVLVSRFTLAFFLSHSSGLSRSRAHVTHIDSSKILQLALSFAILIHLALHDDSFAFPLARYFPTKSKLPYLTWKKKFYHSVSTCSSTSIPPARSMPAFKAVSFCFILR